MNTLEHAYPDVKPGDVFLKVEIGESELTLSIRDEGLPFDQSPESYPAPGVEQEFPERGLGFRLIRSAVDEAHFENLGRRGKVLRMVKRLQESFQPEPVMCPRTMHSKGNGLAFFASKNRPSNSSQ